MYHEEILVEEMLYILTKEGFIDFCKYINEVWDEPRRFYEKRRGGEIKE